MIADADIADVPLQQESFIKAGESVRDLVTHLIKYFNPLFIAYSTSAIDIISAMYCQ